MRVTCCLTVSLQFTAGYTQSLVPLRRALGHLAAGDQHVENSIEVSWLACCVAIIIWDDNSWNVLSAKFVDEGHRTGALVHLLAAVQMRAIERVLAGDFAEAASLVEEKNLLTSVIGPTHGGDSAAIFLAAWQGHELKNAADVSRPPRHRSGGLRPTSPVTRRRCCAMPSAITSRPWRQRGLSWRTRTDGGRRPCPSSWRRPCAAGSPSSPGWRPTSSR